MPLISPRTLRAVVGRLLAAAGADPVEAATVAEVLCWADQRQRYPQGAVWTDVLTRRLAAGALSSPAPMRIERRSAAGSTIDAGNGFGHVAGVRAVELAIDHAHEAGVGIVTVTGSTHFGAAGHYAARVADAGLLGLAMTNAYPKVAAPGGRRPVLGTNPLAFSVPVAGDAGIVGDLSTGALAGSRVREAIERGTELPPGAALDADGRPTTDPRAMEAGGVMLPAAGPKGFALGLLVELLTSVLGGGAVAAEVGSVFDVSRPVGASHVVLAIRPFDDGFAERAARLLQQVTDDQQAVRVPGGRSHGGAVDERGIDLPPESVEPLRRSADRLGVGLPAPLG